ncbi:MAG: prephenate dehydrogenase/arogenate dehydrogenase family protein [Opitutales bacterium]|jgi:cyclohexadieny/prephenate dehydrogenase|tara:strand:- start:110 stop:955 length:846 start_codon:yes stop_codon:yes gene_type:complete
MFQQITILGPGLLGASLAMAVKERGLAARVVTWSRRPESRAKCLNQSWCDAVLDTPEQAVVGSDLVVICTPVQTIVPLLVQIRPALATDALITDVGSTKSLICREARSALEGHSATFLGAHPMAGSEQAGMEHAQSDLFEKAACMLTPLDQASSAAIVKLSAFWETLGMTVSIVSPEKHDEIVAHVSHLPHLLASTLCGYLATQDDTWRTLAGGGLRDTTRVASGDPQLWKQILEQNSDEVLRAIEGFEQQLHHLKTALLNQNSLGIVAQLERGKTFRDQL